MTKKSAQNIHNLFLPFASAILLFSIKTHGVLSGHFGCDNLFLFGEFEWIFQQIWIKSSGALSSQWNSLNGLDRQGSGRGKMGEVRYVKI